MIPEARAPTTLSVSIVVHDSPLEILDATLEKLMQSLRVAADAGLLAGASITIRDNASSGRYREQLTARHRARASEVPAWLDWRLQLGDDNPGFGAAHNAVQGPQSSPFLLILNPDVELHADAVGAALHYLRTQADAVAVNPRCQRPDGSREYLCKRFPSVFDLLLRGFAGGTWRARFDGRLARYEYRDLVDAREHEVELLSGACLLCRRTAFDAAGGFDDAFFLYFEDFDLSRRLAGFGRLVYLPQMEALHHGGFAARKGLRHQAWFARSALRFFRRHGWRWR